MQLKARATLYWPGIDVDITDVILYNITCYYLLYMNCYVIIWYIMVLLNKLL